MICSPYLIVSLCPSPMSCIRTYLPRPAVPTLPHPGAEHRPVADLPPLRQGDQGIAQLLQGEDGPGLRLRPGQDGTRHPEPHNLVRLHKVPQGCGGRGDLRGESENCCYQKGKCSIHFMMSQLISV